MSQNNALGDWEDQLQAQLTALSTHDAAHDAAHLQRVRLNALRIAETDGGNLAVILPAVWLHDCVALPKNDPNRGQSSRMAAARAREILAAIGYPPELHDAIAHAIEAHSYSAGIVPTSLEAKIVQDADRLDALGAIGIARTFVVSGSLTGQEIYSQDDPLCTRRTPNDRRFAVDHFFAKLLRITDTMHTRHGQFEAQRRCVFIRAFIDQLATEVGAEG